MQMPFSMLFRVTTLLSVIVTSLQIYFVPNVEQASFYLKIFKIFTIASNYSGTVLGGISFFSLLKTKNKCLLSTQVKLTVIELL